MYDLKLAANSVVLGTVLTLTNATYAGEFSGIAQTYTQLAHSIYADSLFTAEQLSEKLDVFLDAPNNETLTSAKTAWKDARSIYSQSEVFRFSNPIVDDWEPQVNAWPLDEGFIDYVEGDNYFYELGNPVGKANIIASTSLRWGSNELDLTSITPELLSSLNELGGTEANVATGWHAIEFLLWGQDLNGTEPGAGMRPASDFFQGNDCTNGNCDRRREYLAAVTQLLINDLEFIVAAWDKNSTESYAQEFLNFDSSEQLKRILYGMGSLALGELAGERMKVALFANSTEDEHDCFSDNTHSTLFNNALGIDAVLRGSYRNSLGQTVQGESLLDWAKGNQDGLSNSLDKSSSQVLNALSKIVDSAEQGTAFDQLIAPGNTDGAKLINNSIDALKLLTRDIELLASAMQLSTLNPDNAGHNF